MCCGRLARVSQQNWSTAVCDCCDLDVWSWTFVPIGQRADGRQRELSAHCSRSPMDVHEPPSHRMARWEESRWPSGWGPSGPSGHERLAWYRTVVLLFPVPFDRASAYRKRTATRNSQRQIWRGSLSVALEHPNWKLPALARVFPLKPRSRRTAPLQHLSCQRHRRSSDS